MNKVLCICRGEGRKETIKTKQKISHDSCLHKKTNYIDSVCLGNLITEKSIIKCCKNKKTYTGKFLLYILKRTPSRIRCPLMGSLARYVCFCHLCCHITEYTDSIRKHFHVTTLRTQTHASVSLLKCCY